MTLLIVNNISKIKERMEEVELTYYFQLSNNKYNISICIFLYLFAFHNLRNLVNDLQISKYYILFLVKDVLKISAVILNFLSNTTTYIFSYFYNI